MIEKELLEQIAYQEASIALLYSNFRPQVHGQALSENKIREILKNETDVQTRKEVWEASKQIGKELAPSILKLVNLRNTTAKSLGYENYFSMQLHLQEVDEQWLFTTLDALATKSDAAYLGMVKKIETDLSHRFHVSEKELGPWSWAEPFSQEDPIDAKELDTLAQDVDILEESRRFYQAMGLPWNKS